LNIPGTLVEKAHRFFKLALQNNFTKGRKGNHVAGKIKIKLTKTSILFVFSLSFRKNFSHAS
jgi:hypothetical protein